MVLVFYLFVWLGLVFSALILSFLHLLTYIYRLFMPPPTHPFNPQNPQLPVRTHSILFSDFVDEKT
jgi:hypothetical protein